jgi:hypothetical protein
MELAHMDTGTRASTHTHHKEAVDAMHAETQGMESIVSLALVGMHYSPFMTSQTIAPAQR